MKNLFLVLSLSLSFHLSFGKIQVYDLFPGKITSSPHGLIVYQNKLCLTAFTDIGPKFMTLSKGAMPKYAASGYADILIPVTYLNSLCIAYGDSGVDMEPALWDGVNAPQRLVDIFPSIIGSYPDNMVALDDKLYFTAKDPAYGSQLMVYDTVSKTTHLVNPSTSKVSEVVGFKSKLYYTLGAGLDMDLYEYDPATQNNKRIVINTGKRGSMARHFAEYDGKLYFSAIDTVTGRELYSFDGVNPPVRLTDLAPGKLDGFVGGSIGAYNAIRPTWFRDKLYFSGSNDGLTSTLYAYDTTAKTVQLIPNAPETPAFMHVYHDKLYFSGYYNRINTGLKSWRWLTSYDGTTVQAVDTFMFDIRTHMVEYGDELYFTASIDSAGKFDKYGPELCRFNDSTKDTTVAIANIEAGSNMVIYPNPAKDHINISMDLRTAMQLSVKLADITGKIVYSENEQTYNAGKNKLNIDISALPAGTYTCTLAGDKGMVWSGKVVVDGK